MLLHSISVIDHWGFPHGLHSLGATVRYVGEGGGGSFIQRIVSLGNEKQIACRLVQSYSYLSTDPLWEAFSLFLTVSHLALALSSSNLANSLRSWMVTSSFQIRRPTRPRSRMAPATASSTTKISGPSGHSERQGTRLESGRQQLMSAAWLHKDCWVHSWC